MKFTVQSNGRVVATLSTVAKALQRPTPPVGSTKVKSNFIQRGIWDMVELYQDMKSTFSYAWRHERCGLITGALFIMLIFALLYVSLWVGAIVEGRV